MNHDNPPCFLRPYEHYYESVIRDGKAVIPAAVLYFLDLEEGSPFYFVIDSKARTITLDKSPLHCSLCGGGGELGIANGYFLCRTCVEELLAHPPTTYYP